jgi:2,4-dienoyl-CoA reductase-like NADH-dependent reductase (Old Yellow Enzyme family)
MEAPRVSAGVDLSALFHPVSLGGLRLPNRIVMAPMTRNRCPGGIPNADVAAYYRRRAAGGVGLIVTEGTGVERPAARNNPTVPDFHGKGLEGWRAVAQAVHAAGGRIACQLWHVGASPDRRIAAGWNAAPYESPSGLNSPDKPLGVQMSERDILDTIEAFAAAATMAHRIGFDAVELHGAHGYLIDQFFWLGTNRRADAWGGATLRERTRFAAELVRAVRAAMPASMPLTLRISQWKLQNYDVQLASNPHELASWVEPLAEAGVTAFHCSQRRFWTPAFATEDTNLAGWVKRITGRTTISVGSVGLEPHFLEPSAQDKPGSASDLVRRIQRGEFDLIAVGRSLLGDSQWTDKLKERRWDAINAFEPDALTRLT